MVGRGSGLVSRTWLKADTESVFHGHQKLRRTQLTDYSYYSIQYVVIWVVTKKSLWDITFWCAIAMQESNRLQRCYQALKHDWNSFCYPNKLPIQELTELCSTLGQRSLPYCWAVNGIHTTSFFRSMPLVGPSLALSQGEDSIFNYYHYKFWGRKLCRPEQKFFRTWWRRTFILRV